MTSYKKITLLIFTILCLFEITFSQPTTPSGLTGADEDALNAIKTAIPFISIAPDSRAGAMGDVGVATSPDINSQHWNPAKYAFLEGEGGVALSYTPWLKNLVNDINLAYLVGYYRIDTRQVISGSLRYFSLGDIIFRNEFGDYQGQRAPNEFAVDFGYSRLFSDHFSGALSFRFIRSDITGGGIGSGTEYNAGISFATDLGVYYQKEIEIDEKESEMAFGLSITNIGTKISYTQDQNKEFIPMNLRLGGRLSINLDEYNTISLAADLNKLLVPSPPITDKDTVTGDIVILAGYDDDISVPLSLVQSFYDAPHGFKEEIREIMYSIGMEYWYKNQFAVRGGYFHEHATKGNRKYFTLGIGLKFNVFSLDFAYLAPTSGRNNPLANTIRFTLGFQFDKFRAFN
ncbi:MAG: type IX secretion system outer membrane channel protein PorV [Bacteroidales bacterium]|nr:type IX secretion system outer membrane channel protein PorV [Bacteroidales bacterium]